MVAVSWPVSTLRDRHHDARRPGGRARRGRRLAGAVEHAGAPSRRGPGGAVRQSRQASARLLPRRRL